MGIFFRSEIRRVTIRRKRARRDRPPAGGSLPEVPDRALDAWMTSSAGPFLTMNAGGPLEGVVTIAVATEGSDQLLVEAAWKGGQRRRAVASTRHLDQDSFQRLRDLARPAEALPQRLGPATSRCEGTRRSCRAAPPHARLIGNRAR